MPTKTSNSRIGVELWTKEQVDKALTRTYGADSLPLMNAVIEAVSTVNNQSLVEVKHVDAND